MIFPCLAATSFDFGRRRVLDCLLPRSDRNPYGRYFSDVMNKVDQLYVDPVDNEALFDSAVKGMLQNLDKHSTFFGPREAGQFLSLIDQQYGGIGIEVSGDPKTEQLRVLGTIVGSPAYAADILAAIESSKSTAARPKA